MNDDVSPILRLLFDKDEPQPASVTLPGPLPSPSKPIVITEYKNVRFISWEIHTGPKQLGSGKAVYEGIGSGDPSLDTRFDYLSQCKDIEARVQFTKEAILKAKEAVGKEDPDTLKIFMGPEFLYRGAAGAYIHDMLNGWSTAPPDFEISDRDYSGGWPGLFGKLKELVATDDYKDWLFVFGTAISAFFHTYTGYNKKQILCPYVSQIFNTSLIQLGGLCREKACYVTQKHYKSNIDLVDWYAGQTRMFTMQNAFAAEPESLIPNDVLGITQGGAVFNIPGVGGPNNKLIDFGLEICLDHMYSGGNYKNRYGRIRTSNQFVKIQLVPSGGMFLLPESIRLQPGPGPTPNSYAFNCDGLDNLNPPGGHGSHTQIWNGPVRASNALLEASLDGPNTITSSQSKNSVSVRVPTTVDVNGTNVTAQELWVHGSGSVRVVDALPL